MNAGEALEPADFADLMSLHDVTFVKAAYEIMLARSPDPIGLNYYVSRLRDGYGRISVLNQLAKSNEVREGWDEYPGLAPAIRDYRASRRLKGWRLALTDLELGRTPAIRRTRALQNSIGRHSHELQQTLERLSVEQQMLRHLVSNFGAEATSGSSEGKEERRAARHFAVVRPRRVEDIRDFDLPPAGRSALSSLRF